MKPIVVTNRKITFPDKRGTKVGASYSKGLTQAAEQLKKQIFDGTPIQYYSPQPFYEEPKDEAFYWSYIGISKLLRFYKQYEWNTDPFYCKAVLGISNLKLFIEEQLLLMHRYKGTKESLPFLKNMIDLHVELSKKKNLPKKRKR